MTMDLILRVECENDKKKHTAGIAVLVHNDAIFFRIDFFFCTG